MSMTVNISIKGITELDLMISALEEMGKQVEIVSNAKQGFHNTLVFAVAVIDGRHVGLKKSANGEIVVVGDSDWHQVSQFRNKQFQQKLRQQYSVASVKKKARELSYHVSSVTTQSDGSIKIVARAWG